MQATEAAANLRDRITRPCTGCRDRHPVECPHEACSVAFALRCLDALCHEAGVTDAGR